MEILAVMHYVIEDFQFFHILNGSCYQFVKDEILGGENLRDLGNLLAYN